MIPAEPASLTALLKLCSTYMSEADLESIRAAYRVAAVAHGDVRRKSGELFIEHPIAVAGILAELAVDARGIAAALLHDTVEDTALTLAELAEQFGPTIANIVDGVTKFTAFEGTEKAAKLQETALHGTAVDGAVLDAQVVRERKARQQVETVQKLFLAMVGDPRVVLLKLADRLHNMRTLGSMPAAKREQKSRETLDVYAPLAGRIGLHLFKSELEDLAFSYLQPETYAQVVERLRDEEVKRRGWAQRMCERMAKELAASGICAAVNWRLKHPYRAYIESRDNGMDIALLHDVIAFRVLVETVEECYQALGIIHRLWHPYGERIRDYIASPKINGYQSLHTAVFALDGRLAQMHIRTHAMHRAAQHGVASYWLEHAAYGSADGLAADAWAEERKPGWIAQLSHWHDELKLSAAEFVDTLRGEMFADQVFVFTPKGEIRELPTGSTVLDLAYQIHTKIGDHAAGASVQTNGPDGLLVTRDVPVSYVLRMGDVVRVRTDVAAAPQPGWMQLVATRYAREKIARALRQRERAAESETPRRDGRAAPTAVERLTPLRHPSGQPASVRLGRCCYPAPGDAIVGLADRGRMVTVHRTCCRTLRQTVERRKERHLAYDVPVRVRWEEILPITYRLHLAIYGQDHQGLMHEVSVRIAELGLNVSKSVARANQDRYKAAITLTLDVPSTFKREQVFRQLLYVPGVTQVERDTRKGCDESR